MHSSNLIAYAAAMGVIFLIEGISHSVSCTSTSSTGLFYRPDKLYTAPGPGKRALLDSGEDAQQRISDRYNNAMVRSFMQRLPKYFPIRWFTFKSAPTKKPAAPPRDYERPGSEGIILLKDMPQQQQLQADRSNDEANSDINNREVDDGVELSSDDMFKAENMVSFF